MNDKSKYLIKNMGLLTISNFASKIMVFLLVPLYTSVLTTNEYGIYDLIVSTVSLLYPLLTLNIVDAVMRFAMDKKCNIKDVASVGIKYVIISVLIFELFLVVVSNLELWKVFSGLEIFIGLYYAFYVINQYFIQLAKGLERVTDMGIAGVLGTAVLIVGNILFLLVFELGLYGFLAANILANVVQTIYFLIRLRFWEYVECKIDKCLQKEMLVYCIPLIATTLGWWVNSTSDKYVVAFMCGVAANGLFSVAYKVPQILNTLQGIFIQAWQISAIKEYGEKDTPSFYGKTFSIINLFMCIACAVLIFVSKPIATLLYAEDFYDAWQYVPFLLISSMLNCASGLLGPILSAQKKSKEMAMSAIYGASINIVLNVMLVYFVGIQGATIATVVSSYVIYAVRKRAVDEDIKVRDYHIVMITWVILCIQAVLQIYTSWWGIELALILCILYLNRSQLLVLLKSLKSILRNV